MELAHRDTHKLDDAYDGGPKRHGRDVGPVLAIAGARGVPVVIHVASHGVRRHRAYRRCLLGSKSWCCFGVKVQGRYGVRGMWLEWGEAHREEGSAGMGI